MDIETTTKELHDRLVRLFNTQIEKDGSGGKATEPLIKISYEISNEDTGGYSPIWYCHIYSYIVELRDDEGTSKRGYNWDANSFEELYQKVDKAITDAEQRRDELNAKI
jgi:hypothetical protein